MPLEAPDTMASLSGIRDSDIYLSAVVTRDTMQDLIMGFAHFPFGECAREFSE
jgi:hypothetical protein